MLTLQVPHRGEVIAWIHTTCVLSKLLAEKDYAFAEALIRARLIDPATLSARVELLQDAHPIAVERVVTWLSRYSRLD